MNYEEGNERIDTQVSFLDRNKSLIPIQITNNKIEIKDNYLFEQTDTDKIGIYNSNIFHVNENTNEPKLYEQLIGKNRHKSYGYNILVLLCFNINIAHFCFPFITQKCGILLTILILAFCGFLSYFVQNSLIRLISSERGNTQSNYAIIVENNFGSFCASFLETCVIIWYGLLLWVCLFTIKHLIKHIFNNQDYLLFTYIGYFLFVVVIFLFINRINSNKMIDFDVFFCISSHFINLIFYVYVFFLNFSDNPQFDFGELFIFSENEFYDSFNIFSGSLNTIIVFFWVNNKLSDSSINKHSNMLKASYIFIFIYYFLFIFLKFFPSNKDKILRRFMLCPDFNNSYPDGSYLYYMMITEIGLNIINQIFMLNFYFLVIRNLILRPKTAKCVKGKNYYLYFFIYLLIITGLSFIKVNPYILIVINNGTVGFIINYLIPSFLFVKLSSENFLSFQIISNLSLIFMFSVLSLTSFYKTILDWDNL